MKKGGFLRNVLDTIRQPNQASGGAGSGGGGGGIGNSSLDCCGGQLRPQHFGLGQVARHGFPSAPSALAYDPVQRLAAIGTESGALRVFGRPGVAACGQHPAACPAEARVTHVRFIVNQGALITVTADGGLHLWSLRGRQLKLQFAASAANVSLAASPVPGQPTSGSPAAAPKAGAASTTATSGAGGGGGGGNLLLPESEYCAIDHTKEPATDNNKQLQMLHSLRFKRERITCLHQTLQSRWLYLGTERGNVHVVSVDTFQLSGYSIAWNRAIELARKSHPGPIIHLSECPQDTNKLLIGYQSGCIVLWDLRSRSATCRYFHLDSLHWLSWLHDGKQFLAGHANGTLVTWQVRSTGRPHQVFIPHARRQEPLADPSQSILATSPTSDSSSYGPITKVEWRQSARNNSEPLILFAGGLATSQSQTQSEAEVAATSRILSPMPSNNNKSSSDQQIQTPDKQVNNVSGAGTNNLARSLTVMQGKTVTVLDLEQPIVDFLVVSEASPHDSEPSEPSAAFVLLQRELLIIDLQSSGFPRFRPPYPVARLAESPVTCIRYLADCDPDLVSTLCSSNALLAAKVNGRSGAFSEREWPVSGGEWEPGQQSYPELVLTGHADGSVKVWDMGGLNLDLLAELKTGAQFEPPDWPPPAAQTSLERATCSAADDDDDDEDGEPRDGPPQLAQPFALDCLEFCSTSWRLLVAGALGQVIQFRLLQPQAQQQQQDRKETQNGLGESAAPVITIEPPTTGDQSAGGGSNRRRTFAVLKARRVAQTGAKGPSQPRPALGQQSPRARSGGFRPELICLSPFREAGDSSSRDYLAPPRVTAMAYQSAHSILAYAHEQGVVLVDIIQRSVIINAPLADLYGGGSLMSQDISIQPFATSSILQQHYQQTTTAAAATALATQSSGSPSSSTAPVSAAPSSTSASHSTGKKATQPPRLARGYSSVEATGNNGQQGSPSQAGQHNGLAGPRTAGGKFARANDCGPSNNHESVSQSQTYLQQTAQLRRPRSAAGVFQRQLSTTALTSEQCSSPSRGPGPGTRLIQRQMTASQLLSHDSAGNHNQRAAAMLAAARAGQSTNLGLESSLASSTSCLSSGGGVARSPRRPPDAEEPQKKPASSAGKGKRIISRMLSISTIHSGSMGSSSGAPADSYSSSNVSINEGPNTTSVATSLDQASDKIDSSFTRSRSSSCSSSGTTSPRGLQLSNGESIQCLHFLDWTSASPSADAANGPSSAIHNNKSLGSIDGSAQTYQLALWLGTSQGSVLLLGLLMPDNDDNRILQLQSVNAEPIPQATIRLRGPIRCLEAFSSDLVRPASGQPPSPPSPPPLMQSEWGSLEANDSPTASFESRKSPINASGRVGLAQLSQASCINVPTAPTFLAIISERQARIYQLPDQVTPASSAAGGGGASRARLLIGDSQCVAKANFPHPARSSALMRMRQPNETCLATQLASTGQILVHSLPHMKLLSDSHLEPIPTGPVEFSRNGHALYQPSPDELNKLTLNAQYRALMSNGASSHLYVAREMPDVPRSNFFKSLLGSVGTSLTNKQCDRDELFGGNNTNAELGSFLTGAISKAPVPRALAKHIGTSGLDRLRGTTTTSVGSEIRAAREGLDERGEKLSEVEDRTLQMMNQSETYSQTSHQLAQKFKDKKWYQF